MNKENMKELPLIPLRGLNIFPYMVLHFDVGRTKSIAALEAAMVNDQEIFLVSQKDLKMEEPDKDGVYEVGTLAKIKQLLKMPGNTIRVLVEGIERAKIVEFKKEEPFYEVLIRTPDNTIIDEDSRLLLEAMSRSVLESFDEYVKVNDKIFPEILLAVNELQSSERLADVIAANVVLKNEDKQKILECFDQYDRLETLNNILIKETKILKIENKINNRVKNQTDKVQREYYLKEKLRAIQEELGEDGSLSEIEEYQTHIVEAHLPEEANDKAVKELDRLSKMSPNSAEGSVIRTYLDCILDLPWNIETEDNLDLKNAAQILDEDHYGLEKVKERVLEYLAIRQLTKTMKGPILCFVGPPGVGKTSISKSIARSLDRKFVRLSLGGMRDEAEIRGHRRTYVGAIPGRVISSIMQAGSKNPVFLFDEIDKMSGDFRGDPAAALMEVLDPEQNSTFRDHYLDIPFDLSEVMFIATANTLDTIPQPLMDRMEIIHISGYTEEEKLNIASKYLIPKQLKEHGLNHGSIQMSDKILLSIISNYTRESGVRNLEREIATVCRKVARRIIEEGVSSVRVTKANLYKYLGPQKFHYDKIKKDDEVGVVTGLAWTQVGGVTLSIEVTPMPGDGKLVLTGQLGDVMKESARAGFSYIRSKARELGLEDDFHGKTDIHIHIPEGATPKDGPSAGITMTTAVISALTDIPVKSDVAMTGEITLRGRILPIGGLKEKLLAARRAGVRKVLIPSENEIDLVEIPDNIKSKIEIVLVDSMEDVLKNALNRMPIPLGGKNED